MNSRADPTSRWLSPFPSLSSCLESQAVEAIDVVASGLEAGRRVRRPGEEEAAALPGIFARLFTKSKFFTAFQIGRLDDGAGCFNTWKIDDMEEYHMTDS